MLGRDAGGELAIARSPRMARHDADAGRRREALGRELVAHRADRRDRRADEDDSRGRERLGELRVLGEEAVAGMDRLRRRSARAASRIRSILR